MAWLRVGDNAGTNPIVTAVRSLVRSLHHQPGGQTPPAVVVEESAVAVNECFGFVVRCATISASHKGIYSFDEEQAFSVGLSRTPRLLELAEAAGYVTSRISPRGVLEYVLVQDPAFLHMRSEEEITRDRQRKRDLSDPTKTLPVRQRDGDDCRYCGVPVTWADRKSARAGTYDHREFPARPGHPEDLVVACNACNGGRGRDAQLGLDPDENYPLRPVPLEPSYGTATLALFAKHHVDLERPRSQREHASDPAASGNTLTPSHVLVEDPPTAPAAGQGNDVNTDADASPVGVAGPDLSDPGGFRASVIQIPRVGTGLVGSGRAGPGGDGSARVGQSRASPAVVRSQSRVRQKRGGRRR